MIYWVTLVINIIIIFIAYFFGKKKSIKNETLKKNKEYLEQEEQLNKNFQEQQAKLDQELEKHKKELNDKLNNYEQEVDNNKKKLLDSYDGYSQIIRKNSTDLLKSLEEKYKDTVRVNNEKLELENLNKKEKLNQDYKALQEKLKNSYDEEKKNLDKIFVDYVDELNKKKEAAQLQLDEYESKVKAINEEMLRKQKIEQNQAFYKLNLSEQDKSDIDLIMSFMNKINKKTSLEKLVYNEYIKPAADIVVKNVLQNRSFSGIYKWTNIDNGKVYIGKAVDIKKRTYDHLKSPFGLSDLVTSQFHMALAKDGVDKFTLEVLEECDKDKLTEREKYYITFYKSNEVGYNQKIG